MASGSFALQLAECRARLGFDSAKAFYRWLEDKGELNFNYAYYARIESGGAIPSSAVVSKLAMLLEKSGQKDEGDALVRSFCSELFPKHEHLFASESVAMSSPSAGSSELPAPTKSKKAELSDRQVACIGASRTHYFVFLLLTLARKPISLEQLRERLQDAKLGVILSEMSACKLILVEGDLVRSLNTDLRFPKAENDATKKIYASMDGWDAEFGSSFGFESLKRKMLLRRISPRFAGMILSHADLIVDLINSSDEINTDYNTDVLQFQMSISRGRLPG